MKRQSGLRYIPNLKAKITNSKLGYGGTKAEMERLLADASKIAGVEFDISSYSDVIQAIHVMQEEMGIAGTTSEEAASTISGSAASMKSSWENWLTSLGTADMDVREKTGQLIESVKTYLSNALPALGQIFLSIGDLIKDGLGQVLGEETVESMFQGFADIANFLSEAFSPIAAKIAEIAEGVGPRLQGFFAALSPVLSRIGSIVGGVLTVAFDALGTAIGVVADVLSWLWDNILVPIGEFLSGAFCAAVDGITSAFEGAGEVIGGVCDALGAAWDGLSKTASDVFGGIADTIGTAMDDAGRAVDDAGSLISSALSGDWDAVQQKTDEIWQGVQQRIQGSLQNARNTVVPIADKIGSALGFPGLGEKVDRVFQGIQKFMEDPIENARKTIEEIPGKIVGFFSGLGERISRAIGSIHFPTPHVTWDKKVDIGPVSFTLPTVKWYAAGGFVDRATLIGAGEAGPEMVLPQRGPMMDAFADAVADRLGGGVTVYLDYTANEDATEIANDIAMALSRKLAMEA